HLLAGKRRPAAGDASPVVGATAAALRYPGLLGPQYAKPAVGVARSAVFPPGRHPSRPGPPWLLVLASPPTGTALAACGARGRPPLAAAGPWRCSRAARAPWRYGPGADGGRTYGRRRVVAWACPGLRQAC